MDKQHTDEVKDPDADQKPSASYVSESYDEEESEYDEEESSKTIKKPLLN